MANAYDFFPHGDSRHYWYIIRIHFHWFYFHRLIMFDYVLIILYLSYIVYQHLNF